MLKTLISISSVLGLVVVTIASVILAVNSDRVINANNKLMDWISTAYGFVSAAPIPKEDIAAFKDANEIAKAQGRLGYWLFAIGFVLQLAEPLYNAVMNVFF